MSTSYCWPYAMSGEDVPTEMRSSLSDEPNIFSATANRSDQQWHNARARNFRDWKRTLSSKKLGKMRLVVRYWPQQGQSLLIPRWVTMQLWQKLWPQAVRNASLMICMHIGHIMSLSGACFSNVAVSAEDEFAAASSDFATVGTSAPPPIELSPIRDGLRLNLRNLWSFSINLSSLMKWSLRV